MVVFRGQRDPVLNLASPGGMTKDEQRLSLDAIVQLYSKRLEQSGDSEIANRIASYELAFRMQSAAPDFLDAWLIAKPTS